MAHDPLSLSTRRARGSLIAASAALIFATHYNVSLTSIQGFGFNLDAKKDILTSTLTVLVVFFLLSFLVYVIYDTTNIEHPDVSKRIRRTIIQNISTCISHTEEAEKIYRSTIHERDLQNLKHRDINEAVLQARNLGPISADEKIRALQSLAIHLNSIAHSLAEAQKGIVQISPWINSFRIYVWDIGMPLVLAIISILYSTAS